MTGFAAETPEANRQTDLPVLRLLTGVFEAQLNVVCVAWVKCASKRSLASWQHVELGGLARGRSGLPVNRHFMGLCFS